MRHDLQKAAAKLAVSQPMRFLQPGASLMGGEPKGVPVRLHTTLTDMACASLELEGSADFILELGALDHRDTGVNILKEHVVDRGWRREGVWHRHQFSGFVPHRLIAGWGVAGSVAGLYPVESHRRDYQRGPREVVILADCNREDPVEILLQRALEESEEIKSWEDGSFRLASPMIFGYEITFVHGVAEVSFDPAVKRD